MSFLRADGKAALSRAIVAFEARTAAELVVVIEPRAGHYLHVPLAFASLAALGQTSALPAIVDELRGLGRLPILLDRLRAVIAKIQIEHDGKFIDISLSAGVAQIPSGSQMSGSRTRFFASSSDPPEPALYG